MSADLYADVLAEAEAERKKENARGRSAEGFGELTDDEAQLLLREEFGREVELTGAGRRAFEQGMLGFLADNPEEAQRFFRKMFPKAELRKSESVPGGFVLLEDPSDPEAAVRLVNRPGELDVGDVSRTVARAVFPGAGGAAGIAASGPTTGFLGASALAAGGGAAGETFRQALQTRLGTQAPDLGDVAGEVALSGALEATGPGVSRVAGAAARGVGGGIRRVARRVRDTPFIREAQKRLISAEERLGLSEAARSTAAQAGDSPIAGPATRRAALQDPGLVDVRPGMEGGVRAELQRQSAAQAEEIPQRAAERFGRQAGQVGRETGPFVEGVRAQQRRQAARVLGLGDEAAEEIVGTGQIPQVAREGAERSIQSARAMEDRIFEAARARTPQQILNETAMPVERVNDIARSLTDIIRARSVKGTVRRPLREELQTIEIEGVPESVKRLLQIVRSNIQPDTPLGLERIRLIRTQIGREAFEPGTRKVKNQQAAEAYDLMSDVLRETVDQIPDARVRGLWRMADKAASRRAQIQAATREFTQGGTSSRAFTSRDASALIERFERAAGGGEATNLLQTIRQAAVTDPNVLDDIARADRATQLRIFGGEQTRQEALELVGRIRAFENADFLRQSAAFGDRVTGITEMLRSNPEGLAAQMVRSPELREPISAAVAMGVLRKARATGRKELTRGDLIIDSELFLRQVDELRSQEGVWNALTPQVREFLDDVSVVQAFTSMADTIGANIERQALIGETSTALLSGDIAKLTRMGFRPITENIMAQLFNTRAGKTAMADMIRGGPGGGVARFGDKLVRGGEALRDDKAFAQAISMMARMVNAVQPDEGEPEARPE